jgi:heterodisulfide reductase subunit A
MNNAVRIGLLVETADPQLGRALGDDLDRDPGEIRVFRAPRWTDRDAPARIEQLCREEHLGHLVVCGRPDDTARLPSWIDGNGNGPIPVTRAALHAFRTGDSHATRTRRQVDMALASARTSSPRTLAHVDTDRTVAVAGGNHAAYQMAAAVLDAGHPVLFLRTPPPDGCFYPVPAELIRRVERHPDVRLIAGASLLRLEGCVGAYRLEVVEGSKRAWHAAGALVVAVDAHTGPLGLGEALESTGRIASLRAYGAAVAAGELDGRAACIWLDRDGQDRRCAGQAALTYAREHAGRGGRPVLLCRQVPVVGPQGQKLYDGAREAGVVVIRYDQALPAIRPRDGGLCVEVQDTTIPGRVLEFKTDLLVAPAPVRPSEAHAHLAAVLRQPLDLEGYLQSGNVRHRPVGAARRGVYFVGGCHDQCDPAEASLEATAVLADLLAQLPAGPVAVPAEKVRVDASKCAACLTCYRQCPHGAIEPNPSRRRMDYLDPACWQCGICAAVCPGRALEHSGLRFDQMHDTLAVAARELGGRAPLIAFACRQSAVPAADAADDAGLDLPADVLLIEVPCAGLVSEQFVLDAIQLGARGALVLGCHHDNCRSLWGSDLSGRRIAKVRRELETLGAGGERVRFHTLAANEPHRLAHLLARAAAEMPAGRIGT